MRVQGIHHIALVTAQFDQMRRFYSETLGLRVVGGFAGYRILFLSAGGAHDTRIELIEEGGTSAMGEGQGPTLYTPGWNHLALEVEDVDAAYGELTAAGVPFASPPEDFPPEAPTLRIVFLRDPDGNLVELLQPRSQPWQEGMPSATIQGKPSSR